MPSTAAELPCGNALGFCLGASGWTASDGYGRVWDFALGHGSVHGGDREVDVAFARCS